MNEPPFVLVVSRFIVIPIVSVLLAVGFATRVVTAGLRPAWVRLRACATVSVCLVLALAKISPSVIPGVANILLNG